MRIGIVGAGAIGGLLGVRLARRGHDVSVLARGATLAALRRGWILNRGGGRIVSTVRSAAKAAELGEQELLVFAVKGPSLAVAACSAGPMIGANTIVVPAMNGVPWWFMMAGGGDFPPLPLESVDPDGAIGRAIALESVVGCVVHATAYTTAPGEVTHSGGGRLVLGEPGGSTSSRIATIADLFRDAGFDAEQSENIRRDIWYKLWGNMTANPISAISGATCDRIIADELVRGFVLKVMAEASEIGSRIGCKIGESGEERLEIARTLGAFKTSMLQDVEAGRALEIDSLLSAPREIAARVGVATPNLDALLGLTRLFARSRGLYR